MSELSSHCQALDHGLESAKIIHFVFKELLALAEHYKSISDTYPSDSKSAYEARSCYSTLDEEYNWLSLNEKNAIHFLPILTKIVSLINPSSKMDTENNEDLRVLFGYFDQTLIIKSQSIGNFMNISSIDISEF